MMTMDTYPKVFIRPLWTRSKRASGVSRTFGGVQIHEYPEHSTTREYAKKTPDAGISSTRTRHGARRESTDEGSDQAIAQEVRQPAYGRGDRDSRLEWRERPDLRLHTHRLVLLGCRVEKDARVDPEVAGLQADLPGVGRRRPDRTSESVDSGRPASRATVARVLPLDSTR
jgi:hypothetical protein